MTVKASPATLGVNFTIESNDHPGGVSRVEVRSTGGHQLAAASVRAMLSRFNTYHGSTLTAAQVGTLQGSAPSELIRMTQYQAAFLVNTADVATIVTGLTADLQVASGVKSG